MKNSKLGSCRIKFGLFCHAKILVNTWSLLFQKATQGGFLNFSPNIFLAFNSRDNTMLWVLNLFSRASSTKLWKRIFKKCLKNFFLTLKVGKWWDCHILTSWERSNLSQKFRWKLFVLKKILCSLNECAHVLYHPEIVENF